MQAISDLLGAVESSDSVARYLPSALAVVLRETGAKSVTIISAESGEWRTLGSAGAKLSPPIELLAEVLDRGGGKSSGACAAVQIDRRIPYELLLACGADTSVGNSILKRLEQLAEPFGSALATVRARENAARRIARLEAILNITGDWRQTGELEPLLVQMAEAAARLLAADRASIFLWDRPNHVLVGRPALGVEGNELRIPDNAGIVGQVVQTREPRRVGSALDQRDINRQVDRSTGYETRTLVCVPLWGKDHEVIGAFEVLNKRDGIFSDDDEAALTELAVHAARAIEATQQFEQLLVTHRKLVDQAAQRVQLIGESAAMAKLRATIERLATTDLAVLITGENGSGKEVVAQAIHYQSKRRTQPFIAVNCAAIAETLLESELFGHEKGAFTDARDTRLGKFELAHGGTLFLDEIGDLSPGGQAKLLRVLEERIVTRVGGSKPIHVDVRVIAATNQDLATMVREKRFRQDLYFRLNVVLIDLPPLRDRGNDVLQLADSFLAHYCRKAKRAPIQLSAAVRQKLLAHRWPGNVRELRNLAERLAYLLSGDTVEPDDLGFAMSMSDADSSSAIAANRPLAEATDEFQIAYIKQSIARAGGNMSEAAESLGLHRSNLYRKMRQLGMDAREES